MFTDISNCTLLSGNQQMINKNKFILPIIPKDGKIYQQTVTRINPSETFVPLGLCLGKRPIPTAEPQDDDDSMYYSEPTKKSKLFLNDDVLYERVAPNLVKIRMPIDIDRCRDRNAEKITSTNEIQPIEVKTMEHLLILTAQALLRRFRLTNAIMDGGKLNEYKVLINEHLGQAEGHEYGTYSQTLPLEFRNNGPRFNNLCFACGMAGVVDLDEVCCRQHTGDIPPKCGPRQKRRYLSKNYLLGGLCFYCTMLNRINRMNFINELRSGYNRESKQMCNCTHEVNFSRMMVLAALSLNYGLFAPIILNKVIREITENIVATLFFELSKQRRRSSWQRLAFMNLLAKNLLDHFASCPDRASNWFATIQMRMADGIWNKDYEAFLNNSSDLAVNQPSKCKYCSAPATFENFMRLGNQQKPYHLNVIGKRQNFNKQK